VLDERVDLDGDHVMGPSPAPVRGACK
jgi:hypothetical protein